MDNENKGSSNALNTLPKDDAAQVRKCMDAEFSKSPFSASMEGAKSVISGEGTFLGPTIEKCHLALLKKRNESEMTAKAKAKPSVPKGG